MDTTVWIAIVGISGPVLMVIVTAIMRQWEKKEEHARQDAVVEAAKMANESLVDGQKEAARLLVSNNKQVALLGRETRDNLGVIQHQLNSEKTETRRGALDSCIAQLALMKEVVDLKKSAGHEPTIEAAAAIIALEKRVLDMSEDLIRREKNDEIAAQATAKVKAETEAEVKDGMHSMLDETVDAVSKQK